MDWNAMMINVEENLQGRGTDDDAQEVNEIKGFIEKCQEYDSIINAGGGVPDLPPPPPPPGRCGGLASYVINGIAAEAQEWIDSVKERLDESG